MMQGDAVDKIAVLARQAVTDQKIIRETIDGVDISFLAGAGPQGQLSVFNLDEVVDKWRERPKRKRGTEHALAVESFAALINEHAEKRPSNTVIFVDPESKPPSMTAVVDYDDSAPNFGQHRIRFEMPLSPEIQPWIDAAEGGYMSQGEFAEFVQDHIADCAVASDDMQILETTFRDKFATPADLLNLARGIEINVSARVKDIRNLASGEAQIMYDETHTDSSGQPLMVPHLFALRLPLFRGDSSKELVGRIRHRKDGGSLKWAVNLYRLPEEVRERVALLAGIIGAKTNRLIIFGRPA